MQIITFDQKGFTLIEIVVVVAVLAIVLSFGMTIDLSAFRGDTFLAEQSKIVSALERARSHAMANMFESKYEVCYNAGNYIIFHENDGHCVSSVSSNELIPANSNIASNPLTSFPAVVFNQLTGNTTDATIHITDGIKSADIIINNEGAINW